MTIKAELLGLQNQDGMIIPDAAVDWAKANPASALHGALEWDDGKAGHQWRVWQVRRLVAVHLVDDAGERKFFSLSIDRAEKGGYRDLDDIARAPDLAAIMLKDAAAELKRVRKKYERVKGLAHIWAQIDALEQPVEKQPAA